MKIQLSSFFLLSLVNSLYFYLDTSKTKCFLEELPAHTMVVGKYKVEQLVEERKAYIENPTLGVQIIVEDPSRHRVKDQLAGSSGRFAFTTSDPGSHSICFSTNQTGWFSHEIARFHLDMVIGDAALEEEDGAHHEKLEGLAMRVRDLNHRIQDIRREQAYQRQQEEEFRDLSEMTNGRVIWWTIYQMIVLALTAVWQSRHLKTFFEQKKLVASLLFSFCMLESLLLKINEPLQDWPLTIFLSTWLMRSAFTLPLHIYSIRQQQKYLSFSTLLSVSKQPLNIQNFKRPSIIITAMPFLMQCVLLYSFGSSLKSLFPPDSANHSTTLRSNEDKEKSEGFWIWRDFGEKDKTLLFPLVLTFLQLFNLYTRPSLGLQTLSLQPTVKTTSESTSRLQWLLNQQWKDKKYRMKNPAWLMGLSLMIFPISTQLPMAINWYFLSSGCFTAFQNFILSQARVQSYFRLTQILPAHLSSRLYKKTV